MCGYFELLLFLFLFLCCCLLRKTRKLTLVCGFVCSESLEKNVRRLWHRCFARRRTKRRAHAAARAFCLLAADVRVAKCTAKGAHRSQLHECLALVCLLLHERLGYSIFGTKQNVAVLTVFVLDILTPALPVIVDGS